MPSIYHSNLKKKNPPHPLLVENRGRRPGCLGRFWLRLRVRLWASPLQAVLQRIQGLVEAGAQGAEPAKTEGERFRGCSRTEEKEETCGGRGGGGGETRGGGCQWCVDVSLAIFSLLLISFIRFTNLCLVLSSSVAMLREKLRNQKKKNEREITQIRDRGQERIWTRHSAPSRGRDQNNGTSRILSFVSPRPSKPLSGISAVLISCF
jgi:hypothetical protein